MQHTLSDARHDLWAFVDACAGIIGAGRCHCVEQLHCWCCATFIWPAFHELFGPAQCIKQVITLSICLELSGQLHTEGLPVKCNVMVLHRRHVSAVLNWPLSWVMSANDTWWNATLSHIVAICSYDCSITCDNQETTTLVVSCSAGFDSVHQHAGCVCCCNVPPIHAQAVQAWSAASS